MLLSCKGLSKPVSLKGCAELKPLLLSILRGWDFSGIAEDDAKKPIIEIEKTKNGYARVSPWLFSPAVFQDQLTSVCDFLVDLIKYYISDSGPLLCLHCAAVAFAEELIVFPSSYEAGKSTISVHLAAQGFVVFADDVLPLADNGNCGIAPGILPRLRLPLPSDSKADFLDFIDGRQGPRNDIFQYVALKDGELAPLGEKAKIKKIITLRRGVKGKAKLTPVKTSDMLRDSIMRNFSSGIKAMDILDRLQGIVEGAECFSLSYPSASEGARLICESFGEGKAP